MGQKTVPCPPNRQVGYREKSATLDHSVSYVYNEDNNIASMTEVINGVSKTYSYTYDEDNRLVSVVSGDSNLTYTYDEFGRSSQTVVHGSKYIYDYIYTFNESGTSTSSQITRHRIVIGGESNGFSLNYSYSYDNNGNITAYTDLATESPSNYTFDSANLLVQELNQTANKAWTWTYDNAGNILSRSEYDYTNGSLGSPTDIVNYTYNDSNWGDLLTGYDGRSITYDTIGNPLSDGIWTYTWKHGRQLASMSDGTNTWNYTYNSDGMRIKRTDGTNTYEYVYNGSQLVAMFNGENVLYFSYDGAGRPFSVTYNGEVYYYLTNTQGDVIYIVTDGHAPVVSYTYDAWGNVLSISYSMASTLGVINPIRYRGYVYDQETGLYYLQSRYYNPEWGRFINADAFAATGQGLVGNNMFAYCGNSPVNNYDPSGNRYCSALTVSSESEYDRFISCGFQKLVMLEKHGKVVDMTEKLNGFMQENAEKLSDYVNENGVLAGWEYFFKNVNDYGELDIKRKENWKFEAGKTYIYKGNVLRYDDPGNINFGYIGAVLFPEVVLCLGAGLNQIKNYGFQFGDIFSFYDDPRDNYMIKYGYRLYKGWY